MPVTPGVRRSLIDIQAEYESGDRAALELLMRAWKGIKELPANDLRSFFVLGGYHGEPFRDQGATDPSWWGGYCEHGTVLFPTWHRAYLYALEQALQSIPGCDDAMLPFWDETSADSLANGLPAALTWEEFELDGTTIPNPLRSFVLPVAIVDAVQGDDSFYSKPAGYETVRYPLSGLVGTPADSAATAAHNAQFLDYDQNVETLNGNVVTWLNGNPVVNGREVPAGFVHQKFLRCLDAPTYTVFSNTTSARAYNAAHPSQTVVPLESPHNSIHLAIGGFDVPGADLSPIPGANGDMGENDTAGLDPVFYFHHCFIDYAFWTWQRRNESTTSLTIDPNDPGAGYSANNPPPAGRRSDERLDANSALHPFTAPDGTPMTSAVVADITRLGYTYGPGSLDPYATVQQTAFAADDATADATRSVHVAGLDRGRLRGSFVISAFAEIGGRMQPIGHEAVLSRWQLEGCANCMSRLEAGADFPLPAAARATTEGTADGVHVRVTTRHELLRSRESGAFAAAEAFEPSFTVEVR
jgi:tyrosinase